MNAPHIDVEQVEAANTAFYEALEQGDFEKVSEFWLTPSDLGVDESYHDPADAGVVSCVHPGWPVLTGRGRRSAPPRADHGEHRLHPVLPHRRATSP